MGGGNYAILWCLDSQSHNRFFCIDTHKKVFFNCLNYIKKESEWKVNRSELNNETTGLNSSNKCSCFFLCLTTFVCTCFCPGHGIVFGIDLPVLQFCWCDYFYYNVSSGRVCAAFLEEPGKNHFHTYCKLCCACPTHLENISQCLLSLNSCNMTKDQY